MNVDVWCAYTRVLVATWLLPSNCFIVLHFGLLSQK